MPRRRQNTVELDEEATNELVNLVMNGTTAVSTRLSQKHYDLLKHKGDEQLECAICLDDIDCRNCFSLLPCGHHYHLMCWMKVTDQRCPLCRQ